MKIPYTWFWFNFSFCYWLIMTWRHLLLFKVKILCIFKSNNNETFLSHSDFFFSFHIPFYFFLSLSFFCYIMLVKLDYIWQCPSVFFVKEKERQYIYGLLSNEIEVGNLLFLFTSYIFVRRLNLKVNKHAERCFLEFMSSLYDRIDDVRVEEE